MFTAPGYATTQQLYESDNSIIYRAVREQDQRPVVLKVLKALQPPPETIARFKREYLLTRNLALPGVIEAYDQIQTENHWVLVMEDFGAESLRRLSLPGQISIERFLALAVAITKILAKIHHQVVIHKDINPSNIVLNPDTEVVKIIDFGISASKLPEETISFEHPTRLEGTPGYLSPEQTGRINRPLDYRTDFYSLGCTFYELLTGELPFVTDDLLELVHSHVARAPRPPNGLRPEIPPSLSAIVLKLMAKNPDERYQSAHGLEIDLTTCLEEHEQPTESAACFDLGRADVTSHFRLPAKLYGRGREIERLLGAFEQVSGAETRLILVAGYSGIGKSALVKELYAPITERKGVFVSGKFEQYERNIPYAPVIEAFQTLIQQLLCESQEHIASWRDKLLEAIGTSCSVLIEVLPQLELITGPMPPPVALSPGDAQFRFTHAIREFVRALAQPQHPLVIFLDDLQWSDSASLDFIKSLTTTDKIPYLFIIGAYRDNEVGPGHPLSLALQDIDIAEYLQLTPLGSSDVCELIADAFRVSPSAAEALANLTHDKTGGNPFFIRQFLAALHHDELIYFRHETGTWEWNTEQIRTRDISDNVVELLVVKLHKLDPETQDLLKWAACLGNQFDLRTLTIIAGRPVKQTADGLGPAISEGFVLPLTGDYRLFEADVEDLETRIEVSYKFAHDRIQQAAYTLIPEAEVQAMHLHIGRRLRQEMPARLLEIVNQLNMAGNLIEDRDERFEIARLNQRAGERAKDAAAQESAFKFFVTGLAFLSPPRPETSESSAIACADASVYARDYELSSRLTEQAAEAAYLIANFEAMEQLAENILEHAQSWEDKVEIYQVKIDALTGQNRLLDAIDVAMEILEPLGVVFPTEPGPGDIEQAIREVDRALGERSIESLATLDRGTSVKPHRCALRILSKIHWTTIMTKQALGPLVAAKMVQLTLTHGHIEESINAYILYGVHLCEREEIERIEQGYRFGQLARTVCAREHLKALLATVQGNGCYHIFHLKDPIRDLIEDLRKGYQAGMDMGQGAMALVCLGSMSANAFIAGVELDGLAKQMREAVALFEKRKQGTQAIWLRMYWQCALNFMRDNKSPWVLKGEVYDEDRYVPIHQKNNDDLSIQLLHIIKVMLYYRFGKYREAALSFTKYVENRYPNSAILLPPTIMYYCLARLALCDIDDPGQNEMILADVRRKQERMKIWATLGPTNYGHKYHLVEAEIARVQGEDSEAREHYDRAIDLARENKYLNEESLALERAALFFRERGRERLAGYYLRDAYYAYQRWVAEAKLEELRQRYPDLLTAGDVSTRRQSSGISRRRSRYGAVTAPTGGTHDTLTTGELPDLDLETVVRASRAIGAEYDQSRLLEQIMRICLTHAGARRGFLILARNDELIVKAEGVLDEDVEVRLISTALKDQSGISHAIVDYVAKTSEQVVLDSATREGMFTTDPHIREYACQSVLCMPILYQGTLVGITYMENNRTPGAFRAERTDILSLLMTQAAVSIENAWLRSTDSDTDFRFTVGGSLAGDTPSYVLRNADHELVQRVQRGEFCYVFNARQMGKSSLRVHTMGHLVKKGYRCAAIDVTLIGSEKLTVEQWYAGVARALLSGLDLDRELDLRSWWRERTFLSPVQRLGELIDEIVLERVSQPIAIFVDEIDMVLGLDFKLDDFFALIRSFYNKRADDHRYAKLSVILLGVATPTDLIQDRTRTPFNIGHAIPMTGFRYTEARTLTRGLTGFENPDLILKAIMTWTGGQPFLSQKLCRLARQVESRPVAGRERDWVKGLVRDRVIDKWRARDEPEHLKTIEARILRSPRRHELLALYRQILERSGVAAVETALESELVLSGLVVREWGRLQVGNLVYGSIFTNEWVKAGMDTAR